VREKGERKGREKRAREKGERKAYSENRRFKKIDSLKSEINQIK